jgi:hypothetical protein
MIKMPNYQVVLPLIPDLNVTTKMRTTTLGNREALTYRYSGSGITKIKLPWKPTVPEWVEVYIDDLRLVNPRTGSIEGGTLHDEFNINGSTINFTNPQSGSFYIICDTKPSHFYGALVVNPKNHQAIVEEDIAANLVVMDTPIIGGYQRGTKVHISYNLGPEFEVGSYVIIRGNSPSSFNGNFQVSASTMGSVEYTTAAPNLATLSETGFVSGYATTVSFYKNITNSVYAEPIIITQPLHGYARLTSDRKSIAYTPNTYFKGNDTFSWALITQHGQVGVPKCLYVKVLA